MLPLKVFTIIYILSLCLEVYIYAYIIEQNQNLPIGICNNVSIMTFIKLIKSVYL